MVFSKRVSHNVVFIGATRQDGFGLNTI
jgi:hypothetical protein